MRQNSGRACLLWLKLVGAENIFPAAYYRLTILAGLEKASIDEAFFDYTKAVKEILLQRFPYLAKVPEDASDGIDTPLPPPPQIKWSSLAVAHLIPLTEVPSEAVGVEGGQKGRNDEGTEKREAGYDDETQVEVENNGEMSSTAENLDGETASESKSVDNFLTNDLGRYVSEDEQYTTTWHDVALSIAAELMDQARGKVREIGYTTSAVSFHIPFKANPKFRCIYIIGNCKK